MNDYIVAVAESVGGLAVVIWAMYELFLSYCTKKQMRDNGRLAAMPFVPRAFCWFGLYVTWLLDVAINLVLGTVLYFEFPKSLTFTSRCSQWMGTGGRRGDIADWFCHGWLNPGEPGHCHKSDG